MLFAGTDPSRWIGGGALQIAELEILRPLVRRGRSRSPAIVRCVLLWQLQSRGALLAF